MNVPRWYIRQVRHTLHVARKMDRSIKLLSIPMPYPPKTEREMYVRLVALWAALGVAFAVLYWAFNVH